MIGIVHCSVFDRWERMAVRARPMIAMGTVVTIAAVAIVAWRGNQEPAYGRTDDVRVVIPARPPPVVALPSPAAPIPAAGRSALETRIVAMAGTPTSVLRNVREIGSAPDACGEIAASSAASFRRFVWLDQLGLLATDDGTPEFARLTKVCDGSPLQSLGGQSR